jgi:prolipoprotein diacylglyceryltransferase
MPIFLNPINPIAFDLGFLKIHWYGIAYFIGIIIGILTIKKLDETYRHFHKKEQIDSDFLLVFLF